MKLFISIVFLFILLAVAFVFGSQNEQLIELNYIIAKSEISVSQAVSLFTFIGFLIGFVISTLFSMARRLKRK
ncbi:lipopolysaccharide assembly protein LapA domain-containing protein [Thalassotalea mangrovi]|uniref:lipopolysaccharide assembly protein LapA domain-containing protein n=1 Tax=Thalassotalea mangrovi TaxID=2572245 RepID=UPI00145FA69C|nr:lipopolysaccharide assembly protein LapA domain-containing protein [Thalassotalea mangrovi]